MPFQFPDPSVQSTIVHPITGETWEYISGAWEVVADAVVDDHDDDHADAFAPRSLEVEVDQNEEQLQAATTMLMNLSTKVDNLESGYPECAVSFGSSQSRYNRTKV